MRICCHRLDHVDLVKFQVAILATYPSDNVKPKPS
jgi:hypothetical protein